MLRLRDLKDYYSDSKFNKKFNIKVVLTVLYDEQTESEVVILYK